MDSAVKRRSLNATDALSESDEEDQLSQLKDGLYLPNLIPVNDPPESPARYDDSIIDMRVAISPTMKTIKRPLTCATTKLMKLTESIVANIMEDIHVSLGADADDYASDGDDFIYPITPADLRINIVRPCSTGIPGQRSIRPVMPLLLLNSIDREWYEPIRDRDKNWRLDSVRKILHDNLSPGETLALGQYPPYKSRPMYWSNTIHQFTRKTRLTRKMCTISDTLCMLEVYGIGMQGRITPEGVTSAKMLVVEAYSFWNSARYDLMLTGAQLRYLLADREEFLLPGRRTDILERLMKQLFFIYHISDPVFESVKINGVPTEILNHKKYSLTHLEWTPLVSVPSKNISELIVELQKPDAIRGDPLPILEQELRISPCERDDAMAYRRELARLRRLREAEEAERLRNAWFCIPKRLRGLMTCTAKRCAGRLFVFSAYLFPSRPRTVSVKSHLSISCHKIPQNVNIAAIGKFNNVSLRPAQWSDQQKKYFIGNMLRQVVCLGDPYTGQLQLFVRDTLRTSTATLPPMDACIDAATNFYARKRKLRDVMYRLRDYDPNEPDFYLDALDTRARILTYIRDSSMGMYEFNHGTLKRILQSREIAREEGQVGKPAQKVIEPRGAGDEQVDKGVNLDNYPYNKGEKDGVTVTRAENRGDDQSVASSLTDILLADMKTVSFDGTLQRGPQTWSAMSHATRPLPFSGRRVCRPVREIGRGLMLCCRAGRVASVHCIYTLYLKSELCSDDYHTAMKEWAHIEQLKRDGAFNKVEEVVQAEDTEDSDSDEEEDLAAKAAAQQGAMMNMFAAMNAEKERERAEKEAAEKAAEEARKRREELGLGSDDELEDEEPAEEEKVEEVAEPEEDDEPKLDVKLDEYDMKNDFFDKYIKVFELEVDIYVPQQAALFGKRIPAGTLQRLRLDKEDLFRMVEDKDLVVEGMMIAIKTFHTQAPEEHIELVRESWKIIAGIIMGQARWVPFDKQHTNNTAAMAEQAEAEEAEDDSSTSSSSGSESDSDSDSDSEGAAPVQRIATIKEDSSESEKGSAKVPSQDTGADPSAQPSKVEKSISDMTAEAQPTVNAVNSNTSQEKVTNTTEDAQVPIESADSLPAGATAATGQDAQALTEKEPPVAIKREESDNSRDARGLVTLAPLLNPFKGAGGIKSPMQSAKSLNPLKVFTSSKSISAIKSSKSGPLGQVAEAEGAAASTAEGQEAPAEGEQAGLKMEADESKLKNVDGTESKHDRKASKAAIQKKKTHNKYLEKANRVLSMVTTVVIPEGQYAVDDAAAARVLAELSTDFSMASARRLPISPMKRDYTQSSHTIGSAGGLGDGHIITDLGHVNAEFASFHTARSLPQMISPSKTRRESSRATDRTSDSESSYDRDPVFAEENGTGFIAHRRPNVGAENPFERKKSMASAKETDMQALQNSLIIMGMRRSMGESYTSPTKKTNQRTPRKQKCELVLSWSLLMYRKTVKVPCTNDERPNPFISVYMWQRGMRFGIVGFDTEMKEVHFCAPSVAFQQAQIRTNRFLPKDTRANDMRTLVSIELEMIEEKNAKGDMKRKMRMIDAYGRDTFMPDMDDDLIPKDLLSDGGQGNGQEEETTPAPEIASYVEPGQGPGGDQQAPSSSPQSPRRNSNFNVATRSRKNSLVGSRRVSVDLMQSPRLEEIRSHAGSMTVSPAGSVAPEIMDEANNPTGTPGQNPVALSGKVGMTPRSRKNSVTGSHKVSLDLRGLDLVSAPDGAANDSTASPRRKSGSMSPRMKGSPAPTSSQKGPLQSPRRKDGSDGGGNVAAAARAADGAADGVGEDGGENRGATAAGSDKRCESASASASASGEAGAGAGAGADASNKISLPPIERRPSAQMVSDKKE